MSKPASSSIAAPPPPRRYPSLAEQVAQALRRAVLQRELTPGELYSASELATRFGVSRSPVREALMRLAEAGMVRFERNRGFRVVVPDTRDIAEIFHLRMLLEVPAARRAARGATPELVGVLRAELKAMHAAASEHDEPEFVRHDRQLHALVIAAGGNQRLVRLVDGLRDEARLMGASTADRSRSLHDICAEHEGIVSALATGDEEATARQLADHLATTGRLLVLQSLDGEDTEDLGATLFDSYVSDVSDGLQVPMPRGKASGPGMRPREMPRAVASCARPGSGSGET